MAPESHTRTPNPITAFVGIAAAFVVVPALILVPLLFKRPFNEVEHRRAAYRLDTRTKLDAEANAKLNSEGWVDKGKGVVHVPITQAMTLVLADLSGKKPKPSTVKVEAPLPMPTVDPTSKEPPLPAMPSAPQGADTIHFPLPPAPPAPTPPAPAPLAPSPAAAQPDPAPAPAPAPIPVPDAPIPAIPPAPAPTQPAEPAEPAPAPAPAPMTPPPAPAPAPATPEIPPNPPANPQSENSQPAQ